MISPRFSEPRSNFTVLRSLTALVGSRSLEFRQLFPEPGQVDVQEALDSLTVPAGSAEDRPYVLVNFIATADGRATFTGRSGALGDEGDRALFHGLRERADAIMVGTRTLAVEGYGRMLGRPERRERRLARGRSAEPLACLVTRSGQVPAEIPLFAEPEARLVIFTPTELELDGAQAEVEVVKLDPGQMTLTTVLRRLRSDHGIEVLLCEGGPMLFGSLLEEGLVDELFLSVAPKLAGGGTSPTISSGTELPELQRLRLGWVLEREHYLYLRYLVGG
jgi:riboflavin-specific deaminase-like protein